MVDIRDFLECHDKPDSFVSQDVVNLGYYVPYMQEDPEKLATLYFVGKWAVLIMIVWGV